ncbi:reverse transcriptase domain-containing protein [Tanacetum coccineum]|uniref:Reverse transcriptase domain-containing protein n=1 Tax=Tanacetum coccineum TaxID=301880 RepID=A0ABQ4WKI6_9ASTR
MRELREDTFSGNKDEDAHDHIDQVLSIIGLFNIPGVSKDAVMLQVFPFTLTGSAKRWVDRLALGTINTWDLLKRPLSKAEALTTIQIMADHSQKWHNGTTSRNIGRNSSKDGLAALVNKLDNLGRDMKKLKESVHAIQVECHICEGPHLDKDCPLNEEVKQVEEVRYGEFGRTTPFNEGNGGKFRVGPPGYYTKIDNRPSYGEKRQSLEELLAKHQEEYARRSNEMEEIRSDKTLDSSSEQIKTITANQDTYELNKLHGVSFISDPESDATEVLQHQLPRKELNPGNFTLPCIIGKFNFYAMGDLGASINVMPRSIFEHLHLTNLRKTNILCEMANMSKKAPLGIVENVLVKIGINKDRISFNSMRNNHKYTNPSERIFMVRPQFPAQSNNQIDYVGIKRLHDDLGVNTAELMLLVTTAERLQLLEEFLLSPNLDDREPKKQKIELDKNVLRAHFCNPIKQNIKEQTKMWPSCDPDKKMCDGGVEICRVSKTGNLRFWYCNYDNERRNIKGNILSFLEFLLSKYGKSQTDALVWDSRYAEWCDISPSPEASSQKSNKPRPRNYTFREWTLIKVGHIDISEPVKKALLKLWLIDCFKDNSAFENNPTHRSFDDYK